MCACNCNRCCCRCCCNNCGNGDSDSGLPSLPGQGSGSNYPVWISLPAFLSARDTGLSAALSGTGASSGLSNLGCLF